LFFDRQANKATFTNIQNPSNNNIKLSFLEDRIINILQDKSMTVNELIECLKENKNALIEQISIMELEGKIKSIAGGRLTIS
jgi:DNA processing protein